MPIYLKFSFFSDSLSVLQSINNCKLDNPLVQDILLRFHNMSSKHIIRCWLPSHTGIKGNEKADIAAKSALLLPPSNFKLPYTDFKPVINKYLLNKWQSVWDTAVHNKLPLLLKDLISDFIFDFTAAGVVPCGGRKTSPRTSTIVQFIFYFGPLSTAIIF